MFVMIVAALAVSGCTNGRSGPATTAPVMSTTITPETTKVPRHRATIVLIVPNSGPNAPLGAEARAGLELSLRHAIEDGRLPDDITMNVRVLDESAKGLARSVDRAVRDEKVIAIFGGLTENTEGVLAPIARRRKVALFSFAWRVGSEPADAVRVGPDPNALVSVTAAAVKAANAASITLVAAAVPSTAGAVSMRDQLVGVLNNPNVGAPPFLTIETSVPSDPSLIADVPIVLLGSGQDLVDQYARIRPTPQTAPASFIVPIDAEGCGARPTKFAAGTRCISRGTWLASSTLGQAFREDAAAAGLVLSWASTIAYDGGGLLAALLGSSKTSTPPAEMRARLLGAGSLRVLAQFEGINGKLIPGRGYENDAQALIAYDGEWRAEPVSR